MRARASTLQRPVMMAGLRDAVGAGKGDAGGAVPLKSGACRLRRRPGGRAASGAAPVRPAPAICSAASSLAPQPAAWPGAASCGQPARRGPTCPSECNLTGSTCLTIAADHSASCAGTSGCRSPRLRKVVPHARPPGLHAAGCCSLRKRDASQHGAGSGHGAGRPQQAAAGAPGRRRAGGGAARPPWPIGAVVACASSSHTLQEITYGMHCDTIAIE